MSNIQLQVQGTSKTRDARARAGQYIAKLLSQYEQWYREYYEYRVLPEILTEIQRNLQ